MNRYSTETVKSKLKQPNGPALIEIEPAWDGLRELVKTESSSQALAAFVRAARQKAYQERILDALPPAEMAALLRHEDPKVRKNAARLTGELKRTEDAAALKQAFLDEQVRLVRPSQILALGALGEADFLKDHEVPPAADASEEKHAKEEREALSTVLAAARPVVHHRLKGFPKGLPAVLTCADHMEEYLVRELAEAGLTGEIIGRGRVRTQLSSLKALMQARSFREILIPLLNFDAPEEKWGKVLDDRACARMTEILEKVYEGEPPYAYRIEIRAQADRGRIARDIAERFSKEGKLVNSTSDYENELRLEKQGRSVKVYLKLCTLPDRRFRYRKGTVAASIHPSVAASVMQMAAPYFTPNARVLDPCCGSGTMLIERAMYDSVSQLMGLDISRRAIRIAEDNFEAAGLSASLIVKDCTKFQVQTKFDEVISNLPFGNRVGDHETNEALYEALFEQLPRWLVKGGVAVFYTMEKKLMRRMIEKNNKTVTLLKESTTEAGGLDPGIYILQVGGNRS